MGEKPGFNPEVRIDDPLGGVSERRAHLERMVDGKAVSIKTPEGSFPLREGERLISIGVGEDWKPFIQEGEKLTSLAEWKEQNGYSE